MTIKMPKVLVVYDSLTGNTARAAELIAEGAKAVKGVKVEIRKINAVSLKEIEEAEAVILGCLTRACFECWRLEDLCFKFWGLKAETLKHV
jgi:NAD(P)H dehydrogenase (quinone)